MFWLSILSGLLSVFIRICFAFVGFLSTNCRILVRLSDKRNIIIIIIIKYNNNPKIIVLD